MVPLVTLHIFSVDTMCVNKREVTVPTYQNMRTMNGN